MQIFDRILNTSLELLSKSADSMMELPPEKSAKIYYFALLFHELLSNLSQRYKMILRKRNTDVYDCWFVTKIKIFIIFFIWYVTWSLNFVIYFIFVSYVLLYIYTSIFILHVLLWTSSRNVQIEAFYYRGLFFLWNKKSSVQFLNAQFA